MNAKEIILVKHALRILLMLHFLANAQTAFTQNDTLVFYPVNNQVLQQYDIRKITIARDGKLWLSADKGIISYDGNDIRLFGRGEGGNLVMDNKSISRSYFDSKGNLFCVIVWGMIYYLNTKTGKVDYVDIHVKREDSSSFDKIRPYTELFIDDDKVLWGGRRNMGFVGYDLVTKATSCYNLPSSSAGYRNNVSSIQKDLEKDSLLWLGTNNGIYSFNKETKEFRRNFRCGNPADSSVSDVEILKIHIKNKDTIWFTTSKKGVGCYSIKTGRYTIYSLVKGMLSGKSKSDDLIFFQYKSENEYYIGSEKSCPGIFNTRTHQYYFNTRIYKSFPGLNINHFVADSSGNLWCIIFGRLYFAKTVSSKLVTLPLQDGYEKNRTTNIFKTIIWDDTRKHFYAAFDNCDAIFVLDSNVRFKNSIPLVSVKNNIPEVKETNVYDIALDQKGRLWSCGSDLRVYDSISEKMVPVNKLYPELNFRVQHFQNIVTRGNHLYLQPSNNSCKAIYRINTDNLSYDSIAIPQENFVNRGITFKSEKQLDALVIDKSEQYAYLAQHNTVIQLNLKTKETRYVTSVVTKEFAHFFNMFWYLLDDDSQLWVNSIDGIVIYDQQELKVRKVISHPSGTYRLQFYNADNKSIMCVLYSAGLHLYDYKNNKQYNLSLSDGFITFLNSSVACVNNILFVGAELNALQYISLNTAMNKNKERYCYLSEVQVFNKPYFTDTLPEYFHSMVLPHDKNFLTFTFSSNEFEEPERLEYRYKLSGIDEDWVLANSSNRTVSYTNLKPGNYTFYASVKNPDAKWSRKQVKLNITIIPAWWQTTWFKIACLIAAGALAFVLIRWRISTVRKQEQQKAKTEKEMLELEAKALRAQMNPHFIFNCMNSIKALIQKKEEDKAITYLTAFSKLIRTIFQNSDKREITLFDEVETCRLYTQLESMRFGRKLSYSFTLDESIDLKSVMVPALILQPFIENAIWHGIMPKDDGGAINVRISKKDDKIYCIVEDNGIGREAARQVKTGGAASSHQSKGVTLTQSRLELSNSLNQRNASVEIVDKINSAGEAYGTKVILVFSGE